MSDVPSSLEYKDQGLTLNEIHQERRKRVPPSSGKKSQSNSAVTRHNQNQDVATHGRDVPSDIEYKEQGMTLGDIAQQRSRRNTREPPSDLSFKEQGMMLGDIVQQRMRRGEKPSYSNSTPNTFQNHTKLDREQRHAKLPANISNQASLPPLSTTNPHDGRARAQEPGAIAVRPSTSARQRDSSFRTSPSDTLPTLGGSGNTDEEEPYLAEAQLVETKPIQAVPWEFKRWWVVAGVALLLVIVIIVSAVVASLQGRSPDDENIGSPSPPSSSATPEELRPSPQPTIALTMVPSSAPTQFAWIPTDEILRTDDPLFGRTIQLSGDGRIAVVGGASGVRTYDAIDEDSITSWRERNDIHKGWGTNEDFGKAVDLTYGGDYLAVSDAQAGLVHIYFWRFGWTPFGSAIPASGVVTVAMSRESFGVVAIGRNFQFEVYKWNGSEWALLGQPFTNRDARWGTTLSLNGDGTIVAFGDSTHDQAGVGRIQVFEWKDDTWKQRGSDVVPKSSGTDIRFGRSAVLSSDGNTLIGGANFYDVIPGVSSNNAGLVEAFRWDGNDWVPKGQPLVGPSNTQIEFGRHLAVNQDGTVLLAATPYSDEGGSVFVYHYVQKDDKWVQRGQTLHSKAQGDSFGYSLAVSRDGNFLAVSASDADWDGRRRLTEGTYVRFYAAGGVKE